MGETALPMAVRTRPQPPAARIRGGVALLALPLAGLAVLLAAPNASAPALSGAGHVTSLTVTRSRHPGTC